MTVILKKASISEIDTFINLEKSVATTNTYSGAIDLEEAKYQFEHDQIYFILKDTIPIGSTQYQEKDKDTAYINGLVIDPAYQGQGIAKEAMKQLLEILKNKKRIELVTHPDNHPALAIYVSLGFVIESCNENHFGDGEPRLVLALNR